MCGFVVLLEMWCGLGGWESVFGIESMAVVSWKGVQYNTRCWPARYLYVRRTNARALQLTQRYMCQCFLIQVHCYAESYAHTIDPFRSAVLVHRALITKNQTVHRSTQA